MTEQNCSYKGCQAKTLSFSECCWFHLEEKDEYLKLLLKKAKEKHPFGKVNLAYVDFSGLDLNGINFKNANLAHTNFSNSCLWHCNFEWADLPGANLSFCDASNADFKNAHLFKANLSCGRFWNTDFTGANLAESNLTNADLLNAKLYNSRLGHAAIDQVKFLTQENFKSPKRRLIPEIRISEKNCREAKYTYSALKQYFIFNGRSDDVTWASFKEMTMQRLCFWQSRDLRYFPSLLMGLLCGYGEKPARIILSSLSIIFLYALSYFRLDSIMFTGNEAYKVTFWDSLYYSLVTFTTLGYGDFIPRVNNFFRILAGSEAFCGAFMIGLFVFTLARRYSAR